MRLSDLIRQHCISNASGLTDVEKSKLTRLLSRVIKSQKRMGIDNTVCSLFDFKDYVMAEFGKEFEPCIMGLLWTLPEVRTELESYGYMINSPRRQQEQEQEPEKEQEQEQQSILDVAAAKHAPSSQQQQQHHHHHTTTSSSSSSPPQSHMIKQRKRKRAVVRNGENDDDNNTTTGGRKHQKRRTETTTANDDRQRSNSSSYYQTKQNRKKHVTIYVFFLALVAASTAAAYALRYGYPSSWDLVMSRIHALSSEVHYVIIHKTNVFLPTVRIWTAHVLASQPCREIVKYAKQVNEYVIVRLYGRCGF